jgi:hypothetical protein
VKYFFAQIMSFKHSGNSCSNTDVFLHRERKRGLFSEFDMKCTKCENSLSFSTDEKGGEIENINLTSASAIISVGGGYSQLAEINATLNIPSMSRALYSKCEDKIRETYRECLSDVISEAGKAEYELAKSEGKVDANGVPLICVVADGAWCKRSYKTKYDSKSGVVRVIDLFI